jgi:hypothetical protein
MATSEPRQRASGSTPPPAAPVPDMLDLRSRLGDIPDVDAEPVYRPGQEKHDPRAIPVPRIARDIRVKIASERAEWKDAFQLVALNYQAAGYEASDSKVRFTPYHALPDTVTFIAQHEGRVVMTFSLVPDNTLLGLPLESIYGEEVKQLRRERHRLAEVISLAADSQVTQREFRSVFVMLNKIMMQYHVSHGGDTFVIVVNPRHSDFYSKAMGYTRLTEGPPRAYANVQDAPAEAYRNSMEIMKARSPKMYDQIFGEWLPGEALVAPKMLRHMVRYLGSQTSSSSGQKIREVINFDKFFNTPRRW